MAAPLGELQAFGSFQSIMSFTWTIEHFSSLESGVGIYHRSQDFKIQEDGLQWFIEIYPGGEAEECKEYVSCFVYVRNATQDVMAKIRLFLRNTDGVVLHRSCDQDDWNMAGLMFGFGYRKTMKKNALILGLVNDTLVIDVKVEYCINCARDDTEIYRFTGLTPAMKMVDDLRKLWVSKDGTDFVIAVGGNDIHVHSHVLGARSKVFAAMFKHDTMEKDTHRVEVTDFDIDTMESFMEFIYSGNVDRMNFDLALELLRASDKYEVSDLKSYLSAYLMSIMDAENVCTILLNADICNAEELRTQAMDYCFYNMSEEKFAEQRAIFKMRPELICDLVQKMIRNNSIGRMVSGELLNAYKKQRYY